MARKFDDNKQTDIKTNNLYGITLITLVKDMQLSLATQRVKECITLLLEMGYSKEQLKDHINPLIKDE